MKPGCILVSALLLGAFAPSSLSKDWLFATTNWNESGNEQVLLIDPESGRIRALWSGGGELDAVVSPDATQLYVSYIGDGADRLAVVDTTTGAILQNVETPGVIRWIFPSTPAMAISPDGRWLYLLKANYSAGSSEYFLLTFDTREVRFIGERAISNCPGPHLAPAPNDGKLLVLCGGSTATQASDGDLVLRLPNFQNFALGRGSKVSTIYTAGSDGRVQAVDVATREVVKASHEPPVRHRRIMPSSGTLSPDGRLWYLPSKIPNDGEQEIEQILVFDTQAMSMTNVITPPGPFWGLALSSDGRWLYASQHNLQNILVIDTGTRQAVRKLAIGAKPSIIFSAKAP